MKSLMKTTLKLKYKRLIIPSEDSIWILRPEDYNSGKKFTDLSESTPELSLELENNSISKNSMPEEPLLKIKMSPD